MATPKELYSGVLLFHLGPTHLSTWLRRRTTHFSLPNKGENAQLFLYWLNTTTDYCLQKIDNVCVHYFHPSLCSCSTTLVLNMCRVTTRKNEGGPKDLRARHPFPEQRRTWKRQTYTWMTSFPSLAGLYSTLKNLSKWEWNQESSSKITRSDEDSASSTKLYHTFFSYRRGAWPWPANCSLIVFDTILLQQKVVKIKAYAETQ